MSESRGMEVADGVLPLEIAAFVLNFGLLLKLLLRWRRGEVELLVVTPEPAAPWVAGTGIFFRAGSAAEMW